jgi:hypothetical protein
VTTYRSLRILRAVKSRKLRWVEHVDRTGETSSTYKILIGKHKRKVHMETPGYGSITLRCIFGRQVVRLGGGWN